MADEISNVWKETGYGNMPYLLGRPLVENWEQRKFGLCVYFRTGLETPFSQACHYVALFQPPEPSLYSGDVSAIASDKKVDGPLYRRRADGECAVLAPIVDCLEFAEQDAPRLLPAVIRLYALNVPDGVVGSAGHLSADVVFEALGLSENGKSDEVFCALRSGMRKCERDVVKDASKLMGDFTDQNRGRERERFDPRYPNDGVPFLVQLRGNGIEVSFKVTPGFSVEHFDVLTCPVEFRL
ncbi:hypothetical protein J7348_05485 [Qipengyuania flava]|uniref:hypothetical protein n=1 Tax=Qipengyuania flava TaxID=192812 RepID=UPI001ADB3245|nr:hypothetical protein [Qipengyuania flava]MBO9504072.1 hypothetical protein [Qipengyuania flava]